jgi:hypothetical protein
MFHPAPAPTQQDVEAIVERASKRILRFLQRRGVISLVTAPATAGAPPAGPAQKRKPIRVVVDPDAHAVAKGNLCGQHAGFNIHAATKVGANDEQGRLALCKYILRPPLANERLTIVDDEHVRLNFKKPWSDGTTSVELTPLALIARLAAIVPPPPAAPHGVLRGAVIAQRPSQPVRARPGARGDCRGGRRARASHAPVALYFVERAAQENIPDRHHLFPLQNAAAPDLGDQDRRDDQEDLGSHGPTHGGAPAMAGPATTHGSRWGWRGVAELTGRMENGMG